jgi:hypothetical protein
MQTKQLSEHACREKAKASKQTRSSQAGRQASKHGGGERRGASHVAHDASASSLPLHPQHACPQPSILNPQSATSCRASHLYNGWSARGLELLGRHPVLLQYTRTHVHTHIHVHTNTHTHTHTHTSPRGRTSTEMVGSVSYCRIPPLPPPPLPSPLPGSSLSQYSTCTSARMVFTNSMATSSLSGKGASDTARHENLGFRV